jgi:uncharacterized membrane protein YhaH (DUF805 family)
VPEAGLLGRMTAPPSDGAGLGGRMRRADSWPYMLLVAGIYGVVLMCGLTAALILLAFAAAVRRLHDVGWSGRWMGPYVLCLLDGIAGPNRCGPDPKGRNTP